MDRSRYPEQFITICLIATLMIASFKVAIDSGMTKTISGPTRCYQISMCGAITSLKYGRNGYVCYKKVFEALRPVSDLFWNSVKDPKPYNFAIAEALKLNESQGDEIYSMGGWDAGYVDYCRLSFILFGYNIEGLVYLYFLLFFISVLMFFLTFRRNKPAVIMLIVFLFTHLVLVKATQHLGPQLCSVHCYRFLPVLAILPLLHILMLIANDRPLRFRALMGGLIQSLVFIFILWNRSSIMWMVVALVVYVAVELWKRRVRKEPLTKMQWWPAVVLVLCVGIFNSITPVITDSGYKKDGQLSQHVVWHSIYLGLALNPTIRGSYSMPKDKIEGSPTLYSQVCLDNVSQKTTIKGTVKKWMCSHYDSFPWLLDGFYNWSKRPDDQDAYSAAFNWLHEHGSSEYYLFNFRKEEQVNYTKEFIWFHYNSQPEKRDMNWERNEFAWSRYDMILKNVVLDAIKKHPLQVIGEVFIDKPLRFLKEYFQGYLRIDTLPLLLLPITLIYCLFMAGMSNYKEILQGLQLLGGICVFSLIPVLLIYPNSFVIADTSFVLTMGIFYCVFILLFRGYKACIKTQEFK
jgi:hypothetical protein